MTSLKSCAMIADYLGGNGYAVCRCSSGAELDVEMATGSPALIILDVAMPGEDGVSIDRAIDIRVTRIRRKTEIDPAKPQVIRTVRSVGYMYVPPRAMS